MHFLFLLFKKVGQTSIIKGENEAEIKKAGKL